VDAGLVRLVVAGVIGAHGVGHVMGWLPAWGIAVNLAMLGGIVLAGNRFSAA